MGLLLEICEQVSNPTYGFGAAYESGHGLYRVLHKGDERLIISALEENVRRSIPQNYTKFFRNRKINI